MKTTRDPNSRNITLDISPGRGRGVFARRSFEKGAIIERAPVIVVPEKQWPKVATSLLSNYAFDWGEKDEHAAIALGFISIYNHSFTPNAQLEQMLGDMMMELVALKPIQPGAQSTVNYNGDPQNGKPGWFRVAREAPVRKGRAR